MRTDGSFFRGKRILKRENRRYEKGKRKGRRKGDGWKLLTEGALLSKKLPPPPMLGLDAARGKCKGDSPNEKKKNLSELITGNLK